MDNFISYPDGSPCICGYCNPPDEVPAVHADRITEIITQAGLDVLAVLLERMAVDHE